MSTDFDDRLERILSAREHFAARQAQGLLTLLRERHDLHGVYALADYMGEGLLWSA